MAGHHVTLEKLTVLKTLTRLNACPAQHYRIMSMAPVIRHDWKAEEIQSFFDQPLLDLVLQAATIHRQVFDSTQIQISNLLSIKTGGCPEDCGYCPQAQRYHTGVQAEKLMDKKSVIAKARLAKQAGASRFCMGAAWRSPPDRDIPKIAEMIGEIKKLGLETCATLGMLTAQQAHHLKESGLDYYNHNLDTSPDYYQSIIKTRNYQDRLETLGHIRDAGLKTCCGGIVGMGESREQRIGLLLALVNLPQHPESVPINHLVQVPGTPLFGEQRLDRFEFVRMIAVARIIMPKSMIRLSAGRQTMSDELQAMCFLAGANSIFGGEKLLTTDNPQIEQDISLLNRLGLSPMASMVGEIGDVEKSHQQNVLSSS